MDRTTDSTGNKRTVEEGSSSQTNNNQDDTGGITTEQPVTKRTRRAAAAAAAAAAASQEDDEKTDPVTEPKSSRVRWKAHDVAEQYVEVASHLVLHPTAELGPYGVTPSIPHKADDSSFLSLPLEAVSTLSYLKSPARRRTVLEEWSPLEVAIFEAAIAEYGKDFYKIQKELPMQTVETPEDDDDDGRRRQSYTIASKSTNQVIEFYYIWKKTQHYQKWKDQYVPPYLDVSDDDNEEDGEEEKAGVPKESTTEAGRTTSENGKK